MRVAVWAVPYWHTRPRAEERWPKDATNRLARHGPGQHGSSWPRVKRVTHLGSLGMAYLGDSCCVPGQHEHVLPGESRLAHLAC